MVSVTKTVDISVDNEQNTDVDIELDKDLSIDLNLDSNVDISGNFANLTFDATAVGDNSFVEGDVSVFASGNLAEVSGTITSSTAPTSGTILRGDITSFDLVADPFMIDLGAGPVSTGPIEISLDDTAALKPEIVFDFEKGTSHLDLALRVDAPLIDSDFTLQFQETGPFVFGVSDDGNLEGRLNTSTTIEGSDILTGETPPPIVSAIRRIRIRQDIEIDVKSDQAPSTLEPPLSSDEPAPVPSLPPGTDPAPDDFAVSTLLGLSDPLETFFSYRGLLSLDEQEIEIVSSPTTIGQITIENFQLVSGAEPPVEDYAIDTGVTPPALSFSGSPELF